MRQGCSSTYASSTRRRVVPWTRTLATVSRDGDEELDRDDLARGRVDESRLLAGVVDEARDPAPLARDRDRRCRKSAEEIARYLPRTGGIDLTRIDGISAGAAQVVLTEVGPQLAAFPSGHGTGTCISALLAAADAGCGRPQPP
jgi:hypothetical protein